MQLKVWAAIVVAAVSWGTTGVATRAALNDGVPPIAMVAIRSVIAAAILLGLLKLSGRSINTDRDTLVTGLVAGVFQLSLPFILFTLAYQYASAGFVGLLVALIPLATAIIAHFLLPDEPLSLAKLAGLSVAFAGVGFLLLSGDSGLAEGGRPIIAALLAIASVVSVSFASVFTRGRAAGFDPIELSWMQFMVGIVLVGGAMLLWEGMPSGISAWGWMLIIYLSVAGSVVPFLLFYWVLRRVSSTRASLVGYLVPLIALVAGIALLDEQLQTGILVGGLLILAGVVLTDRAERRFVVRSQGLAP